MKKEFWIAFAIIAVLFGAAMIIINRPPTALPTEELLSQSSDDENIHKIVMKSVYGDDLNGRAAITDLKDGRVRVIVKITDIFPFKEGKPIHIHEGTCEALGSVKYPLNNVGGGVSNTLLDLTLDQLLRERPLAINILQSPEGISIACGNL